MEFEGNASMETSEYFDACDISSPQNKNLSVSKDSETVISSTDEEIAPCKLDEAVDSAENFKIPNEADESAGTTRKPLQLYLQGTEDGHLTSSTPRKTVFDIKTSRLAETLHNNSYCEDITEIRPKDTNDKANQINLKEVVEALKTVDSRDEDDSCSYQAHQEANVASSNTKSGLQDPSEYLPCFKKVPETDFSKINDYMATLFETNRVVIRGMTKLYFENLNECLWSYFSQVKEENSNEECDAKISFRNLKILFEGFRDHWMEALDTMDLQRNHKEDKKQPEKINKTATITADKKSLHHNTEETSRDIPSSLPTKIMDFENEVSRIKISNYAENVCSMSKEMSEELTVTDSAEKTIRKIGGGIPESSIDHLENIDGTKVVNASAHTEECISDKNEQDLTCSSSYTRMKKDVKKSEDKTSSSCGSISSDKETIRDSIIEPKDFESNTGKTDIKGSGQSPRSENVDNLEVIVEQTRTSSNEKPYAVSDAKDSNTEHKETISELKQNDTSGKTGKNFGGEDTDHEESIKEEKVDFDIPPCSVNAGSVLKVLVKEVDQNIVDNYDQSSGTSDARDSDHEEYDRKSIQIDGIEETVKKLDGVGIEKVCKVSDARDTDPEESIPDHKESNEDGEEKVYLELDLTVLRVLIEELNKVDINENPCGTLDADHEESVTESKQTDEIEKSVDEAGFDKSCKVLDAGPKECIPEATQNDTTIKSGENFGDDTDHQESIEEEKVDLHVHPCSVYVGSDPKVLIEEQNIPDSSEKLCGTLNADHKESVRELKQADEIEEAVEEVGIEKSCKLLTSRDAGPIEFVPEATQNDTTLKSGENFGDDTDNQESIEEEKVDLHVHPCSVYVGSDPKVLIEEQNVTDSSEKLCGTLNADHKESVRESKQADEIEEAVEEVGIEKSCKLLPSRDAGPIESFLESTQNDTTLKSGENFGDDTDHESIKEEEGDLEIPPCSVNVGSDPRVLIEEQNITDSYEKPCGTLDARDSNHEKSAAEPKETHGIEDTAKKLDGEDFYPDFLEVLKEPACSDICSQMACPKLSDSNEKRTGVLEHSNPHEPLGTSKQISAFGITTTDSDGKGHFESKNELDQPDDTVRCLSCSEKEYCDRSEKSEDNDVKSYFSEDDNLNCSKETLNVEDNNEPSPAFSDDPFDDSVEVKNGLHSKIGSMNEDFPPSEESDDKVEGVNVPTCSVTADPELEIPTEIQKKTEEIEKSNITKYSQSEERFDKENSHEESIDEPKQIDCTKLTATTNVKYALESNEKLERAVDLHVSSVVPLVDTEVSHEELKEGENTKDQIVVSNGYDSHLEESFNKTIKQNITKETYEHIMVEVSDSEECENCLEKGTLSDIPPSPVNDVSTEKQNEDNWPEDPIVVSDGGDSYPEESTDDPKVKDNIMETSVEFKKDSDTKGSDKGLEKETCPDILPRPVIDASTEKQNEDNSPEFPIVFIGGDDSYPEESTEDSKQKDTINEISEKFEKEVSDSEEYHQELEKETCSDIPTCLLIDASIEKQNVDNSAENPIVVSDGDGSYPEERTDDPKQKVTLKKTSVEFEKKDPASKECDKGLEEETCPDIPPSPVIDASTEKPNEDNCPEDPIVVSDGDDLYTEESTDAKVKDIMETSVEFKKEDSDSKECREGLEKETLSDSPPRSVIDASNENQDGDNNLEDSIVVIGGDASYPEESNDELKQKDTIKEISEKCEKEVSDSEEYHQELEKETCSDIPTCLIVDASIEKQNVDNSAENPKVLSDGDDSYPEESTEDPKQKYAIKETSVELEKEDLYSKERNEGLEKETYLDIPPSSVIEVSTEKQNLDNNAKNPIVGSDGDYSYVKENNDDPKQNDSTKKTCVLFRREDTDSKECDKDLEKETCFYISPSVIEISTEKQKNGQHDPSEVLDGRISYLEEPIDEPRQFDVTDLINDEGYSDAQESSEETKKVIDMDITSEIPASDLEVSSKKLKEGDSTDKLIVTPDRENSYNEKSIEKTTENDSSKEISEHLIAEDSEVKGFSNDGLKKTELDILPCSAISVSDIKVSIEKQKENSGAEIMTMDFHKENSLSEESTDELEQIDCTKKSSAINEDTSDAHEEPKRTVDLDIHLGSVTAVSDLKVSTENQLEADNSKKPIVAFDKDSYPEESIENLEENNSAKETTGNLENDSNAQESNEKVNKEKDVAVPPCSEILNSDLEVSTVKQMVDNNIEEITADFDKDSYSEGCIDNIKQSDSTEASVTSFEKDFDLEKSNEELKNGVDTAISSAILSPCIEVSIEEQKTFDSTEEKTTISKRSSDPHSAEKIHTIEGSSTNFDEEESKGLLKGNEEINNANLRDDVNSTDLNKEPNITDFYESTKDFGRDESPVDSIVEPTEIEGVEIAFSNSKTEDFSPIESNDETKMAKDGVDLDDTFACFVDNDSSTENCIEKLSEKGDTVVVETTSDCEKDKEQNTKDDAEMKNISLEKVDLKLESTEETRKLDNSEKTSSPSDNTKTDFTKTLCSKTGSSEIVECLEITDRTEVTELSVDSEELIESKNKIEIHKESEKPAKTDSTGKISESSIDVDIPKETISGPRTSINIGNASTSTYNADNDSEKGMEITDSRPSHQSGPSPLIENSLSNINPASVWDLCDTFTEPKAQSPKPRKDKSETCSKSPEKKDSNITLNPMNSDAIFFYDLYRLISRRREPQTTPFQTSPGSVLSAEFQENINIMLLCKEREMYFVALQHKVTPVAMAEEAVNKFVKRRFCVKSFLWLVLYICQHFVYLEQEMEDCRKIMSTLSSLSAMMFILRKKGEFTDETWKDVKAAAKSIAEDLNSICDFEI